MQRLSRPAIRPGPARRPLPAPEVPGAQGAAGVRREQKVPARGQDARVERAVVRAVVLDLQHTQGRALRLQTALRAHGCS